LNRSWQRWRWHLVLSRIGHVESEEYRLKQNVLTRTIVQKEQLPLIKF
jgi:hypothetical protein